jgi:hypothetical protein
MGIWVDYMTDQRIGEAGRALPAADTARTFLVALASPVIIVL